MKKKLLLITLLIIIIFMIVFFVFYKNKVNNDNKKFVMYIEEGYTVNKDLYLTGIRMRGKVTVGDTLEIVSDGTKKVVVKDILVDNKSVDKYNGKKRFSVSIGEIELDNIKRGTVLATKSIVKETKEVSMNITLDKDTQAQIQSGSVLVFKIGFENYAGTVSMKDSLVATQTGNIDVVFDDKVPVYKGAEVIIKLDGLNEIGKGNITIIK